MSHSPGMKEDTLTLDDLVNREPADIASHLERLPPEAAQDLLRQLPPDLVGSILKELEPRNAASLIEAFTPDQIITWMQGVPPNVAADLVMELPGAFREPILKGLPAEKAGAVAALLRYPPDSAGGIMDNRFIAVRSDETVEHFLTRLRTAPPVRTGDVAYIYVTDESQRLIGVVSLRDLVFASPHRRIGDIMNPEVHFLRTSDDQEEIARQIQHYSLLGLPVVDDKEHLVGVVKIRDAIRVAQTEATEDMQLMVGLSGEERIWTPWRQSIAKRLPWLGVNLGTALGAAGVVSVFENTISRWTALIAFLPLISAVAGNAGNQALTVTIRSLALGEVTPGDALRALRKELIIGIVNGFVLAVAIGLLAFGWKESLLLGAVAGLAMLINQVIGAASGVAIPFALQACRIDPALASSILVTALTDTLGFLVFLGLAMTALQLF